MGTLESNAITEKVRAIITAVAPDAIEKSMYGGTVYELADSSSKRLLCGIFVRKGYVTLELDGGPRLVDDDGVLEGEGKTRRHIKLIRIADVDDKHVRSYIEQSFRLSH
jgi:hypothetical protein